MAETSLIYGDEYEDTHIVNLDECQNLSDDSPIELLKDIHANRGLRGDLQ